MTPTRTVSGFDAQWERAEFSDKVSLNRAVRGPSAVRFAKFAFRCIIGSGGKMTDIVEKIQKEWAVISGAPWSFVTVVVVLTVVIWFGTGEVNKATLSAKDATIETLKTQLERSQGNVAPAATQDTVRAIDAVRNELAETKKQLSDAVK
jgi:hypothetical protein